MKNLLNYLRARSKSKNPMDELPYEIIFIENDNRYIFKSVSDVLNDLDVCDLLSRYVVYDMEPNCDRYFVKKISNTEKADSLSAITLYDIFMIPSVYDIDLKSKDSIPSFKLKIKVPYGCINDYTNEEEKLFELSKKFYIDSFEFGDDRIIINAKANLEDWIELKENNKIVYKQCELPQTLKVSGFC